MAADESRNGIMSEMTIEEINALDPEVVVFGIASTEPHGPHLPYNTDTEQTEAVCRRAVVRANEADASVLKYPTLPIGNNTNFKAFPFACRMRVRTLMNVVLDVIEAVEEEGVEKIVLVNGHGGNTATLKATLREHADRHGPGGGAFACMVNHTGAIPDEQAELIEHPSSHAGELETSRMMAIRPDLVKDEEFDEFPIQQPKIEQLRESGVYFVPRWDAYMPASAGGETRASSAEKGEAILEGAADWLAELLLELDDADVDDLFPYDPPS